MTEAEAEAAATEDALETDIADTDEIEASEIVCVGSEDVMSTFGYPGVVAVLESDEVVIANPLDKSEEAGFISVVLVAADIEVVKCTMAARLLVIKVLKLAV